MTDLFVAPDIKKEEVKNTTAKIKPPEATLGKNVGLFSSFRIRPENVSFSQQDDDETIYLFLRRHFITNLVWVIFSIILGLIPVVISLTVRSNFLPFPVPPGYLVVLVSFYYLIVFAYIFINFLNWFYNISLVTDKRVLDLDYSDIVYHDVALTKLNLIEDVTYVQSGFARSLFNYGDIFIQTAGEKLHFDFLSVPDPKRGADIIENLMGGDHDI
ncbi:hypothetical protein M1349_05655 [Patescibacteria group bacterium]|nr:hypothetical protein [Patescibacteria group bacterium]